MIRIISCQFNIDTACVDVEYEDGFVLSIYTPTVEDAVAHTMQQRSELDWLIYNIQWRRVQKTFQLKKRKYFAIGEFILTLFPFHATIYSTA